MTMLAGILVLSLPTGVIGAKFEEAYQELEEEKTRQRENEEREKAEEEEARRRSSLDSVASKQGFLQRLGTRVGLSSFSSTEWTTQATKAGSNGKGKPTPPPLLSKPPPPPMTDFAGSPVATSSDCCILSERS